MPPTSSLLFSAKNIDYLIVVGVLCLVLIIILIRKVSRRRDSAPVSSRRSSRSSSRKSSRSTVEAAPAATSNPVVEAPPLIAQPAEPSPAPLPTQVVPLPVTGEFAEVEPPASFEEDAPSELWVKIELEKSSAEDGDCFVIQAKAHIRKGDYPRRFVREISLSAKGPSGEDQPVYTVNPLWHRPDGRKDFYYASASTQPGAEDLHSTQWITVLRIPINQLEFAWQGVNEFRALVSWRDRFSKLVIARGRGQFPCQVLTPGYAEQIPKPSSEPKRHRRSI